MSRSLALALLAATVALLACASDDDIGDLADERSAQAEAAALEAGLGPDVAEFVGRAARGPLSTYSVTYPAEDESELVVTNRPPDRRVDVVLDDTTVETRLVVDGQAFHCTAGQDIEPTDCRRTDAVVDPPGVFDDDAVEALTRSLRDRTDDFAFSVEQRPMLGVEATCLVTRIRPGRRRPEIGDRGTMCVAPGGAVLLVEQLGESLEATAYDTDVPADAFHRPG